MKTNPYTDDCGCNNPDIPVGVLPDTFNTQIEGVFVPTTEPFLIPLCVTLEQYQAIVDSLDYAKGLLSENDCKNERTAIELLHSAMLHVNDPIGADCMATCDIISECITENADTQDSIINMLIRAMQTNAAYQNALFNAVNNPLQPIGQEIEAGEYEANLMPDVAAEECDYDALWGACVGVVKYINRNIEDLFQNLEQSSNTIELAAITAGAVPAVGDAVAAAAELADQILETLAEAYEGEYTQEVEDGIACDLFCLAKANGCTLSLEDVNAVFLERLATIDFDDFASFAAFAFTGAVEGIQIVEVAFMLCVQALRFGGKFAGAIGLVNISVVAARAAEEAPSSAWQILCNDCQSWEQIWNAENGWDGWELLAYGDANPTAEIDGVIVGGQNTTGGNAIFNRMRKDMDASTIELRVFVEYARTAGGGDNGFGMTDYDTTELVGNILLNDTSGSVVLVNATSIAGRRAELLGGVFGRIENGQYLHVTEIRESGTGVNPYLP